MATISIPSTPEQIVLLSPFLKDLESGGSIIAQVYPDGFLVTLLTPEEARNVNEALQKTRKKHGKQFASTLSERKSMGR
jgi:hypothetical protein